MIIVVLAACASNKVLLLKNEVMLSPPSVIVDSIFFYDHASITYEHSLEGSQVEQFSQEQGEFVPLSSSEMIHHFSASTSFRATKNPFKPSETVDVSYFKIRPALQPNAIQCIDKPAPNYNGGGEPSLINHEKSELNFRSGKWLGFDKDSVTILLTFDSQKYVTNLVLSALHDQNSWILPPSRVRVSHNETLIHDWLHCPLEKEESAIFEFPQIDLKGSKVTNLRITLYPSVLPIWHAGAGSNAWIFLDEILIE